MLNIYIVGCGGIGGYLVDLLPMSVAGLSLDLLDPGQYNMDELLATAGTRSIPSIVDSITLIDGDTFNARNALRQGGGAGSKLEQRVETIKELLHTKQKNGILLESWLRNMRIFGYNSYVNPENIGTIIPLKPEVNADNLAAGAATAFPSLAGRENCAIVMMCVDNKKTRYEISKYMEAFDDCLVINGGNNKTSGQVTVYERRGGQPLDPNLYDVFPDVTADADKRPDEIACGTVAPKHDQVADTNALIATWMSVTFKNWARKGLTETKKRGGKLVTTRTNEILIDTEGYTTMPLYHPLNKRRNNGEEA